MSAATVVKKIDALVDRVDKPLVACGVAALTASACMLFIEVILRYFYGSSQDILEELSTNLVVWCVMFLGGPAFKRGSHVGMEFLAERLRGRLRAAHFLVISVVILGMCGLLFWKGVEVVRLIHISGRTTMSGELSLWYMMIPVPLGALIFCFYLICAIAKSLCVFADPALYDEVFPPRNEVS